MRVGMAALLLMAGLAPAHAETSAADLVALMMQYVTDGAEAHEAQVEFVPGQGTFRREASGVYKAVTEARAGDAVLGRWESTLEIRPEGPCVAVLTLRQARREPPDAPVQHNTWFQRYDFSKVRELALELDHGFESFIRLFARGESGLFCSRYEPGTADFDPARLGRCDSQYHRTSRGIARLDEVRAAWERYYQVYCPGTPAPRSITLR